MITKRGEGNPLVRIAWSLAGALLCAVFLTRSIDARRNNPQADSGVRSVRSSDLLHSDVPGEEDEAKAVLTIPPGTILPIRLNSPLSSVKSKRGQAITGRVMQDVPLPAGAKIREGSKVIGHIVAITPATGGGSAEISFQFDKLVSSHQATPITTNLRAIAGITEVLDAQTAQMGAGEGDVWNWRTTTQIGGDVVYGVGGPVTTAENAEGVVGTGVDSSVLSRVSARKGTKCRGVIYGNENPQALWVFSSDACGTYGLERNEAALRAGEVVSNNWGQQGFQTGKVMAFTCRPIMKISRAGRTSPAGLIVLSSDTGRVAIPSGAGMLLRVVSSSLSARNCDRRRGRTADFHPCPRFGTTDCENKTGSLG